MLDYKLLYSTLFNSLSDAITAIEEMNFGLASEILKNAQQQSEDVYIRGGESDDV